MYNYLLCVVCSCYQSFPYPHFLLLVTINVCLCCISVIVYCIKPSASVLLVIIVSPLIPATTCSSINKQTLHIIMHVDGHYMRTIVVLLVCVHACACALSPLLESLLGFYS